MLAQIQPLKDIFVLPYKFITGPKNNLNYGTVYCSRWLKTVASSAVSVPFFIARQALYHYAVEKKLHPHLIHRGWVKDSWKWQMATEAVNLIAQLILSSLLNQIDSRASIISSDIFSYTKTVKVFREKGWQSLQLFALHEIHGDLVYMGYLGGSNEQPPAPSGLLRKQVEIYSGRCAPTIARFFGYQ